MQAKVPRLSGFNDQESASRSVGKKARLPTWVVLLSLDTGDWRKEKHKLRVPEMRVLNLEATSCSGGIFAGIQLVSELQNPSIPGIQRKCRAPNKA